MTSDTNRIDVPGSLCFAREPKHIFKVSYICQEVKVAAMLSQLPLILGVTVHAENTQRRFDASAAQ